MCSEAAACATPYRGSGAPVGGLYACLSASINPESGWRKTQFDVLVASPWAVRIGIIRQPR